MVYAVSSLPISEEMDGAGESAELKVLCCYLLRTGRDQKNRRQKTFFLTVNLNSVSHLCLLLPIVP